MKKKKNRTSWISIVITVILLTVITAYISIQHRNDISKENTELSAPEKQYVCSMHPQIVQGTPGDCPICGMFLIEKISDDKNSLDSSLKDVVHRVNESVLAAVARVNPVHTSLPVTIEASGIVTCDPRMIRTVSANFGGVIEKSFIKYQFQPVRKGQKIYQIYCPEIYIEKWNYVKLIQAYPDQDNLTVEAREWFRLLGLTNGQIDSLKRAVKPDYHLMVYSDVDGYVVDPDFNPDSYFLSGYSGDRQNPGRSSDGRIELNDGVSVEKGTSLFKVIDPVFLRADKKIRTEEVGLLKIGQKVNLTDEAIKGYEFSGIISQIEPLNGGFFQIMKVYIRDYRNLLLPGRQIRGRISTENHESLWLPETAVLDLGNSQSVFLYREGKFISAQIRTGIRYNKMVEILSGVDSGSEVALNGFLLIDSDGFIVTN